MLKIFDNLLLASGKLAFGVACVIFLAGTAGWSQEEEPVFTKPNYYQVTTHPDVDLSPRISPDGKWMAYVVRQSYNWDIWIRGVKGGRSRQITFTLADDFYPVWAPDGKSLFYVSQTKDAAGDIWRVRLREVKGMMLPRGEPERLTDYAGFDGYPSVSGDGKRLAFVSDRSGRDEIWLLELDSRRERPLTFLGGTHPVWCGKRDLIAFTSFRAGANNNGDIWLMDLAESKVDSGSQDSREPTVLPLTVGPAADGFPSWSADGKSIAFLRFAYDTNQDGALSPADEGELWLMQIRDATESKKLPPNLPLMPLLQNSFNFTKVCSARPLTSGGTHIMQPWYSPDGYIYFSSDRGGNLDVWSVPNTGPIPRQNEAIHQFNYAEQLFPLDPRTTMQNVGPLYLGIQSVEFSNREKRAIWDRILALRYVIEYFPQKTPIMAQAIYEIGLAYAILGFKDEAEKYWRLILQDFDEERKIQFYAELALLGLKVGKIDDTKSAEILQQRINQIIGKYKDIEEPAAAAQLSIGDIFSLAGENIRAFREYSKVQAQYPQQRNACAAAQLKIGDVFKTFASQQEVINAYLEVLKNYPDQRQWMVPARDRILRLLTTGSEDDQQLIARLREIVGQYQEFAVLAAEAQYRIGEILAKNGEFLEAAQEFEVIESLFPNLPIEVFNAQLARIEAMFKAGESIKSFQILEALVDRYKKDNKPLARQAEEKLLQLYLDSADQLRMGGDLQLASIRYRAAWKIDLHSIHAHRGYLECKYYMREIDHAISEYRQLNALHPGNNILQYALGLAYSYKGTEKAELDGDPDGLDPNYLVSKSGGTIARALSLDYTLVPAYLTISYNAEMMENYEARQRAKPKPFLVKVGNVLTAPIVSLYRSLTFYEETKPVRYYERAIHELNKAIVLNDETVDPKLEASLALNLANNYYNLGEFGYEKAYEYYQIKLKYDSTFIDQQREALIYERMGHCALVTEDLEKGPRFLLRAIELYEKMAQPQRMWLNIKRLALLYEIGRRYDMAIEYYQRAAELEARAGDKDNLLKSYRSIAYNFLNLGEPSDAIAFARKAYDLLQSGEVKVVKGEASRIKMGFLGLYLPLPFIDLRNMAGGSARSFTTEDEEALIYSIFGDSYTLGKDYESAIPFILKKIEIFRKRKDAAAEAIFYNNLGYLYFLRGDYKKAWNYFHSSLRVCEKNNIHQGIIENCLNLSRIVSSWHLQLKTGKSASITKDELATYIATAAQRINAALKKIEEAETFYYRERCQLLLQLAELTCISVPAEGGLFNKLQNSLQQMEKFADAVIYLNEVLDLSRRYRLADIEVRSLYALGEVSRLAADTEQALTNLRQARRLALRQGQFDMLWRIDLSLGDLYAAMDRQTKHRLMIQQDAGEFYFEAIDVLEAHPELSKGDMAPQLRRAEKWPYQRVIHYLAQRGDSVGSLAFAERMKSKAFLSLISSDEIELRKERHKIFLGNARFIQKKLNELNSDLLRAKNQPDIPLYQVRAWQRQRNEYLQEYDKLIDKVREEVPELENMVRVNPIRMDQLQQQMNKNEAIIFYQPIDSILFCWTITHKDIKLQIMPFATGRVYRNLDSLASQAWVDDFTNNLLLSPLLQPLARLSEAYSRIVIVADERLLFFPWSAMVMKASHRSDLQISICSSLTAYYYAMQKRKIQGKRIFIADYRPLVQVLSDQGYQVAQAMATPQRDVYAAQVAAMSLYDIIHLRVESNWNTMDPLQSKIGFRVPRSAPAVFNIRQIYQNNFAATLIVLQPNSPLSSLENEEPFIAWERGIIYSGAPAMLVSLWPGSSAKEVDFYRNFYAHLQNEPAGSALLKTQKEWMERGEPFSEWGRFQLFGFSGMTLEEEQHYAAEGFAGKVRLGHSSFDLREWSDAIRFYEEALQMAERQHDLKSVELLNQRILECAVNGAYWDKAIEVQSRLLRFAEETQNIGGIANSYNNLAYFYSQNGQFDLSISYKSKYTELASRYGLYEEKAKSLREMGLIYERGNQPAKALELFMEAKEQFAKIHHVQGQAQCLRDMGRIYFMFFDNYTAALDVQQQALSLFQKLPLQIDLVDIYQNLGITHEKMGNYQLALECQRTAHEAAQKLQDQKYIGLSHQYLANVLWKMGDYQSALTHQNKAMEIFQTLGDEKLLQVALATRGLIALSFNQFEEALNFEQQAMQYALQRDDRSDQATILKNIGLIHRAQRQNDAALVNFEQAAAIDSTIGSKIGLAYSWRNLAAIYGDQNQLSRAIPMARRALALSREIGDARNEAQSLLVLAGLINASADKDTVSIMLREVIQIAEKYAMPDITWRAQKQLAQLEKGRKNVSQAEEQYFHALDTIEGMRARIQVEEYAAGFIDDKLSVYDELIELLVDADKAEEALMVSERARSRSFLDMLGQRRIDFSSVQEKKMMATGDSLRSLLNQVQMELNYLRSHANHSSNRRLQELEAQLISLKKAYSQHLIKLREYNQELSDLVQPQPIPIAEIQRTLPDSVALIEYYLTPSKLYVWVVTNRLINVFTSQVGEDQIEKHVFELRRQLERQLFVDETAIALYGHLIKPIATFPSHIKHLIVVPHKSLHYLPFSILHGGDRQYLAFSYTLSQAPSGTVFTYCVKKGQIFLSQNRKQMRMLALGNPDLGDQKLNLPFAEREVRSMRRFYPHVQFFLQAQATETQLLRSASDADLILFSCHAEFDEANPLLSALLLTSDASNDGRLEAHEIFGLCLQSALVAMSACETGLGTIRSGDEVVGLSRSFIYAGAASLLSSLWKVDDLATAVLVKRFFRYLSEGYTRAEALQKAQRIIYEEMNPYPAYWAAFTITGDFR